MPRGSPSVPAIGADFTEFRGFWRPAWIYFGRNPVVGLATGNSYATSVVSGVAALLFSLQRKRGRLPSTALVRDAMLRSALECDQQPTMDRRRHLAGPFSVEGAVTILIRRMLAMSGPTAAPSDVAPNQDNLAAASPIPLAPTGNAVHPAAVEPSACGCQAGAPQLMARQVVPVIGPELRGSFSCGGLGGRGGRPRAGGGGSDARAGCARGVQGRRPQLPRPRLF